MEKDLVLDDNHDMGLDGNEIQNDLNGRSGNKIDKMNLEEICQNGNLINDKELDLGGVANGTLVVQESNQDEIVRESNGMINNEICDEDIGQIGVSDDQNQEELVQQKNTNEYENNLNNNDNTNNNTNKIVNEIFETNNLENGEIQENHGEDENRIQNEIEENPDKDNTNNDNNDQ